MKKILTFLAALVTGSVAFGQAAVTRGGAGGLTVQQTGLQIPAPKFTTSASLSTGYLSTTKTAGTTGTTANLLVKLDSSGNVVTAATSDVGILGIAATTATNGNPVEIATRGIINGVADNTTVIGNVLIVGTLTGGRVRDSGTTDSTSIPLATQVVGKALSVATVGNAVSIQLYGPGHYGAQAGTGSGSVTSVSVATANGVSGSVANPTTTPAITITLGDITPSKVTTTGINSSSGSNVSPVNSLGAFAIDVTKYLNTKTIATEQTFTFSGTPATAQTWFALLVTNSDSASHVLTIPSSFSIGRNGAITTVTIPASGKMLLTWQYDGSVYNLYGDPVATTGSGSFVLSAGTLAITSGKTLTVTGSMTQSVTDASTVAFGAGGTVAYTGATQTLTATRTNARITSISSSATPTVNTDNCDCVTITALAAAITSMTSSLSGTPVNFDQLEYRILDNGTARAITWGSSFASGTGTLPTTTIVNKALCVYFEYDSVQAKWMCQSTGSYP